MRKNDLWNNMEGVEWEIFDEAFRLALEYKRIGPDDELSKEDLQDIINLLSEDDYGIYDVADMLSKVYYNQIFNWYGENFRRMDYVNDYVQEFGLEVKDFDIWRLLYEAHRQYIVEQLYTIKSVATKLMASINCGILYQAGDKPCQNR